MKYDHQKIESKWQRYWAKHLELFSAKEKSKNPKQYILDMFPYPSSDGLHTGHVESYTATDIISRYWRLRGKNVLHPQGWDAFGLPAENYAIKTKTHPSITTQKAIKNFKRQMQMMGFSYDWSREVNSSDPDYYKWTQWFFLLLYKNNLAYKAKAKANWCPNCQTVLANEQAEGGVCERCGTPVTQKDLEQWLFKITDFIEDRGKTSGLINGLDKIDWPEHTKIAQRNWIGKSEGAQFEMKLEGSDLKIEVFTTRLDTVFGMTFALISPEHPLVEKLKDEITNWPEVEKYIEQAKRKSELQRIVEIRGKTGVELKDVKVINPFTQNAIPLFASDFILAHYGTGAVMAVPGHDQRDYEFAKKFNLPIPEVIKSTDGKSAIDKEAYIDDGVLVNSGEYNGLTSAEARKKLTEWLEKQGIGKRTVNYKLRDWLVSRQRYWGAPIPIIYCDDCKTKKYNYVILHGYVGTSKDAFLPALKAELEKQGHSVFVPDLPNPGEPRVEEQADFVMKNAKIDANTIIVGWSLGGVVAMRILEKTKKKIARLFLVDSFIRPEFQDQPRENVVKSYNWKFNYKEIKQNAERIDLIVDNGYPVIGKDQAEKMSELLHATSYAVKSEENHFVGSGEGELIKIASENGIFAVPERDLPVKLPKDVDFMPHGESPLVRSKSFHNVKCPRCGGKARRESDTMDTFVCSSWYYFRYTDPKNKKEFAAKEKIKYWLAPARRSSENEGGVDLYVGGAEHTVLHLLYSRFFTKVLHNLGYIDFDEPFAKMRHQGIILAEDGRKMSKSLGNVITPDSVVEQYGADALRMFEMFMGPLEDMKVWSTKGIIGISRFLERAWKLNSKLKTQSSKPQLKTKSGVIPSPESEYGVNSARNLSRMREIDSLLHKTIKKVSEDIENLKFNTAISALMILVNEFSAQEEIPLEYYETFLKLLSPFAPHIVEELWSQLGCKKSIFAEKWPEYDPALIKDETIELVVQINGKVRARLFVPADISEEEAKNLALADENVKKWLGGQEPKKVIFVRGRLVNIVV